MIKKKKKKKIGVGVIETATFSLETHALSVSPHFVSLFCCMEVYFAAFEGERSMLL